MRRGALHRFRLLAVLALAVALAACKEHPIQHNLNEEDANTIIVLLYHYGIKAKKVSEEKNQVVTWNIVVSPDDEPQARELLVENNLPRKPSLGLSGVCKEEGLIPTPKREKCRELLAYKGELVNSLVKVTGVVDADVVLTIPDREEAIEEGKEPPHPTASVVIKTKMGPNQVPPFKEEQLQKFVANAVPGMDPRDVSVIIAPVSLWETTSVAGNDGAKPKAAPAVAVKAGNPPAAGNSQKGKSATSPATPPAAVGEDESAYTTILGIKVEESSARRFRQLGVAALAIFLVLSALLIVILYVQIRNKRKGTVVAASAQDAALTQAGGSPPGLLEAPTPGE